MTVKLTGTQSGPMIDGLFRRRAQTARYPVRVASSSPNGKSIVPGPAAERLTGTLNL